MTRTPDAASVRELIMDVRQDDLVRYAPLRWANRAHALADAVEELLNALGSIRSRALDETLSHEERLLAIERLTRVRP